MKTQSPLYSEPRRRGGGFFRPVLFLLVLLFVPPAIPHLLSLRDPGPPKRPADAIFVLTGGEGRIQEGFHAWAGGAARELYILGAGRRVPITRIVPEASRFPPEALSRIHVEGWSENTLENAFSAKSAVGEGKYSSIILVTSDYHIPRAVLAFRKVLPMGVSLTAIRVRPEGGGAPPGAGRGGVSSRGGNTGDIGSCSGGSERPPVPSHPRHRPPRDFLVERYGRGEKL